MVTRTEITIPASFQPGTIINRSGARFRAVAQGEAGTIFTRVRRGAIKENQLASFEKEEILKRREIQARQKELLEKATKKLLTPQERAELERVTAPPKVLTREAPGILRTGGLSPIERVRLVKQRQLEAERGKILSRQESLDVKAQELQARRGVLERLANSGNLLPGVAAKFNTDVESFIQEQKDLNNKSLKTEGRIAAFKKPAKTRVVGTPSVVFKRAPDFVVGVPKTSVEVLPEAKILQEMKLKQLEKSPLGLGLGITRRAPNRIKVKPVKPIVGVQAPDVILSQLMARTRQTLFGFGEIGAGLTLGGLGLGANIAGRKPTEEEKKLVERFGRAAGITVAAPIAPVDAILAEDTSQLIGLEQERLARLFRIRPEELPPFRITEPTAKGIIKGAAKIPFFGELIGAKQAVTRKGVFLSRPALTEFGATVAFFGAPEFAATKSGRLAAKVPSEPIVRAPTQIELEIAEISRRKLQSFEQMRESFAALQKQATQAELERLLGKPKPTLITKPTSPTKEAVKFGKIDIKKTKSTKFQFQELVKPKKTVVLGPAKPRDVKILKFPKIGERGTLFPGRLKKRPGVQIQIFKPKFLEPIRIPAPTIRRYRVIQLKDLLKQFELKERGPRFRPSPIALAILSGTALVESGAFKEITLTREGLALKEFKKARQKQLELTIPSLRFGVENKLRNIFKSVQAERQAKRFSLRLRPITTPKPVQIIVPKEKIIEVPRPAPPKKRPTIIIPLPKIEEPEFLVPVERKVPGFVAFVKEKPFAKKKFRKVSKVLPEEVALERGLRVADLTIAQSVRLKRAKKKVRPQPRPFTDLRFKFRKKKDTFIEKRKYAIDTLTEKQELGVSKFLAQEKIGFFDVTPKRKKKTKRKRK